MKSLLLTCLVFSIHTPSFAKCIQPLKTESGRFVFQPPVSSGIILEREYSCKMSIDTLAPFSKKTRDSYRRTNSPTDGKTYYVHANLRRAKNGKLKLNPSGRGQAIQKVRSPDEILYKSQFTFQPAGFDQYSKSASISVFNYSRQDKKEFASRSRMVHFQAQQVVSCNSKGQEEVRLLLSSTFNTPRFPADLRSQDSYSDTGFYQVIVTSGRTYSYNLHCNELSIDSRESCDDGSCQMANAEGRHPSSWQPRSDFRKQKKVRNYFSF